MFSLIRNKTWRGLLVDEGPALLIALAISELFFKFHSFILEGSAFLVVWYVLGAAAWATRHILAREEE
jgi:hypothetical protein